MQKTVTLVWDRCRVLGLALAAVLLLGTVPVPAQTGALSSLTVEGLSPAFSPMTKDYTVPRPASCAVPVTATLSNSAHMLYVASNPTASGQTRQVWACGGVTKISVVVYQNWTEVGRYTLTLVDAPPPPPPAPATYLTSLTIPGLMPAFDPATTQYTMTRTSCAVPVTATLTDPTHKLYVGGNQIASGGTSQAWVCDGQTKISVVVYQVWTEKARYTVDVIDAPTPPTPPAPPTPPTPPSPPTPPTPPTPPAPSWEPNPVASVPPSFEDEPLPTAEPVDALTAERFLQQATFGPTAALMQEVMANGPKRWIAMQLKAPITPMPDGLDTNQVRAHLFEKMANGQDQLRQRMMFALSQTLVVSNNKLVNGYELIPWVSFLEKHTFGNYRALLRDMTISPSMGKFLDLANSVGTSGNAPNENYPRELLQLFSIGLVQLNMDGSIVEQNGQPALTYTQATIKEVARALSGWTYPTAAGALPASRNQEHFVGLMEPRPVSHDPGAKTLLNGEVVPAGQTVTQDLESVIDNVFNHPNVAPFVATRLIRSLVTSNPSGDYIQRVAQVFENNGDNVRGDLRAVFTAILTDPEATLSGQHDGRLRDPILHVIGLARALGINVANAGQFQYVMVYLGQAVLAPTTVFSFYSPLAPLPGDPTKFGPEFQIHSPAMAIARANFIYDILNGSFSSSFPFSIAPYVALAGNPQALVEEVNQKLLFGRMSNELRERLVLLAQQTSSLQHRAFGTLYLTAISSEFMVLAGNPPSTN